jgi:hypothetical protein
MSRTNAEEGCLSLFAVALGLALILPMAFYRAFFAAQLWAWFVTPTLGIAVPSYAMIAGLLAFASLVTTSYRKPPKDETALEAIVGATIYGLMAGPFCLAVGFALHLIAR